MAKKLPKNKAKTSPMTWDNLSYPCNICNGKFQQQVQSVASRACWKFQEQVQSVASRACWKFQEQVQSVASRARWKFQGQVQSVASRFCCRTHTDDRRRMDVILFIFSCTVFLYFFWGRGREIQQKGRGANENDKYLSRLSSLNLAAT